MAEYVSQALRDATKRATALLYDPEADLYFEEGPRAEPKTAAKINPRKHKGEIRISISFLGLPSEG